MLISVFFYQVYLKVGWDWKTSMIILWMISSPGSIGWYEKSFGTMQKCDVWSSLPHLLYMSVIWDCLEKTPLYEQWSPVDVWWF